MRIAGLGRLRLIVAAVVVLGGRYLAARFRLRRQPLTDAAEPRPRPSKAAGRRAAGGLAGIPAPLLRQTLEKLGPTFVKLGQVLSLRPDFVGERSFRTSCPSSKATSRLSPSKTWSASSGSYPGRPARCRLPLVRQTAGRSRIARAGASCVPRPRGGGGGQGPTSRHTKGDRPGHRHPGWPSPSSASERLLPAVRPYSPVQVVKEFADWTRLGSPTSRSKGATPIASASPSPATRT